MRLTSITVGRTYNTGNYTSQRFELSAELESDDDPDRAMMGLAFQLDNDARAVMRRQKEQQKAVDDHDIPF